MKHCKYCSRGLPLEAFSKRKASPDGLSYKCRECQSAYAKNRWATDVDYQRKTIDKAARWAKANRDKRREITKAYDDKNRDAKRQRECARAKRLRAENPEKERLKGRIAAQVRRHRAVESNSFPHPAMATRLLNTANGFCTYCENVFEKLTLDHFHPVSKGGDGSIGNMVPCCASCNSSKKDRDGPAWIENRFGIERLIAVYWRIEALSAARLP